MAECAWPASITLTGANKIGMKLVATKKPA